MGDFRRRALIRQHRPYLIGMGVLCGYLGAAPSIVWASGALFAAAFVILVPIAVWIYALVFAFSSLWFSHYCLAALQLQRAQVTPTFTTSPAPPGDTVDIELPIALPPEPHHANLTQLPHQP